MILKYFVIERNDEHLMIIILQSIKSF